jgi:hypothetical protein
MTDTPTGHDRIPDRYAGHGRETIDEMRDIAHAFDLGDEGFALHCILTALKYHRRAGKKGTDEDAAADARKQRWYEEMASHAMTGAPDPRAGRPDYAPYEPRPLSPELLEWCGVKYGMPKPLPPDVPTVDAVESGFVWWQFGDVVVELDNAPVGLQFYHPNWRDSEPVDPTDPRWLGPVTLRAVRS